MRILGLSAYHQDSAAALVVDGKPVAAAQEGLFTKTPLDASLPLRAARSCLSRAGLNGPDLDAVVFYEKPLRRFERTLATSLRSFPRGGKSFAREVSQWFGDKLWVKGRLADELGVSPDKIRFLEHMRSHAASAFYLSPFQSAAVLVADDIGEWATTGIFRATADGLEPLHETHLPHSLGLAVSAFTQFLGFDPGKDDLHLADLAACGQPRFREQVERLIGVAPDGSPRIDVDALPLGVNAEAMWSSKIESLFGPARIPGSPLRTSGTDTRDADLAASVEAVLEDRLVDLARLACEKAGEKALCFAGVLSRHGGVNRALLQRGGLSGLFVPPEPSDAGGALGAALWFHHEGGERKVPKGAAPAALFLGERPGSVTDETPASSGVGADALLEDLRRGAPVAWVRGELEFADESLLHRLAMIDPAAERARERLLGAVQRAEPFLQPRLALPAERLAEFVEVPEGGLELAKRAQLLLPARDALRSALPGAVSPTGMVRAQAVDRGEDPALHALLTKMGESGPAPALLLETLRLRGGVTPRADFEALDAFHRTVLEAILIDDRLFRAEGVAS